MSHVSSGIFKSLGSVISSYFSWIKRNASGKKVKDPISIRSKKLKILVCKISKNLKIEYRVDGLDKIPQDTRCAFLPNHMSAFDPLAVISCYNGPTTFISKVENKKLPFIGKVITAMDGLFIDRKDLKQTVNAMMIVENDLKEQNKSWIIFPEGTRNKDIYAPMLEFRRGVFRAIMKAQAPIVPVAMYGTFKVLHNKRPLKKYPVYVTFLDPIMPEEYNQFTPEELLQIVKEKMQKVIDSLREKYFNELVNLYKRAKDLINFKEKKLA